MNRTPIYSEDPNAATKLAEKIEYLEHMQKLMRDANRAIRKAGVKVKCYGYDYQVAGADADRVREELEKIGMNPSAALIARLLQPDFAGRIGYADFELKNNGANIRRLKKRLAALEAA